jgi:hypothetical protein
MVRPEGEQRGREGSRKEREETGWREHKEGRGADGRCVIRN